MAERTERTDVLTRQERNAIRALGLIFVSRQLGLYMVLPVLSLYAAKLPGATSLLIGLSLGVYGAGQAIFQVPFGYLSDRIGRKRAINFGLILFAAGSVMGALAHNAWALVIARTLQGSAAFSSVVLALIADVTRESVRTQAMGRMGAWIGITIGLSVMIGPTIAGLFGIPLLFLITAAGAGLSILYLDLAVPNPPPISVEERLAMRDVVAVLRRPGLLMVDIGIFLVHLIVTVLFVILPFEFDRVLGSRNIWEILAPAIALGLATMLFVTRHADRHGRTGFFFYVGTVLAAASCLAFAVMGRHPIAAVIGLFLFVMAIAILEPILATLLSHLSTGPARGTASGVYSMAQFLGAFVGGVLGGAFLRHQAPMFFALVVVSVAYLAALPKASPVRE